MTTEPNPCPCGSTLDYAACCEPIVRGDRPAPSAEALMRSRYSAYARGEIDHVLRSIDPEKREDHDPDSIRHWSESSVWRGLTILEADEENGRVEFVARYRNEEGEEISHHELSQFRQIDGAWYFVDGQPVAPGTVRRAAPKVGRNDPCPCGSGRKYKKCCATKEGT